MTREEAIAIIENEKECVNRANKNDYCNRDCYNCELVKTDTEILMALDMAIQALQAKVDGELISKKAVLDLAYDMSEIDGEHFTEPCMVVDVEDIQKLPPVTQKSDNKYRKEAKRWKNKWLKSQKSGKWILTDDDFVYCSECEDSYYPRPIDASWYYCPHCGSYNGGDNNGNE